MTKSKITMQDIADHLQISKNSVSQALTGKGGVSEETRKLIMQTADALGYVYNGNRKRSSDQEEKEESTGNIALVATDFAFSLRSFFGEIYLTIENEVQKRGKKLLIQSISKQMLTDQILPPFIEGREVDGILILSHLSTEYMNTLIDTGIPTVLIDHHHPDVEADAILTNNRFSAYRVVKYLYELGHTRIGYVGNLSFSPSYYERLEGFRLAHYELGIELNPKWMISDALEDQEFIEKRLQELDEQPTAWFCVNDGLGFIVNSTLYKMGYQIPSDISIVSFDNGQLSRLATPKTTTMGVDLGLFGKTAIQQLFWRMEHTDTPHMELLLPTTLIERDSVAAPRG
ncbi:LacI family DNA-binding transcriptional regulator [Paenibacillus glycanilyticus]|uniref:LacI family transcriptional regulator n=1 Tax=Paenibacillus glycanilyticus TaxID=126569 RepID=A0ABQ6G536_9BACL|nr:LacI family DNA-binding transcriptional regulator [Paenibacillus glycanilyticus]GLX66069.1 LacI family transcriptional regulator [Paenibacillus glycanilyticus]